MGFILKSPKSVFKSYKPNTVYKASYNSEKMGNYYFKRGKHLYNVGKNNQVYSYYKENGKTTKRYYNGVII